MRGKQGRSYVHGGFVLTLPTSQFAFFNFAHNFILLTDVYHSPTYGYDLEGFSREMTDLNYFDNTM